MDNVKIDSVRSSSSGTVGRAISQARNARLVLDSSSHPHDDTLTNSEAFLAGVASCGVTLIEGRAQELGVPLRRMNVDIEGMRTAEEPNRYASVTMRFQLVGVTQPQADDLVATYRGR